MFELRDVRFPSSEALRYLGTIKVIDQFELIPSLSSRRNKLHSWRCPRVSYLQILLFKMSEEHLRKLCSSPDLLWLDRSQPV